MPKLNKANHYAIQWLYGQGKTDEQIADELGISKKQVINVTSKIQKPVEENSTPAQPDSKSLMITQTSGKGTNSVAIMTKQASELGDALKKSHVAPKSSTGIFRPKK
jgi:DNA-directed RNA polymerase specialized sigma subunit